MSAKEAHVSLAEDRLEVTPPWVFTLRLDRFTRELGSDITDTNLLDLLPIEWCQRYTVEVRCGADAREIARRCSTIAQASTIAL